MWQQTIELASLSDEGQMSKRWRKEQKRVSKCFMASLTLHHCGQGMGQRMSGC